MQCWWSKEEESGTRETRLPSQVTTTCTLWTSTQGCLSAQSTISGGRVQKPWAAFSMSMVDSQTKEAFWVGTADSRGNAFTDQGDLRESLVLEIIIRLAEERVFR